MILKEALQKIVLRKHSQLRNLLKKGLHNAISSFTFLLIGEEASRLSISQFCPTLSVRIYPVEYVVLDGLISGPMCCIIYSVICLNSFSALTPGLSTPNA